MFTIISNIPFFVWPLFFILLAGGLKARKPNSIPLAVLLLIPSLFFGWSFYNYFGRYGTEILTSIFWALCLATGFLIGYTHIQRLDLSFDKTKRMVAMPGSWIPLMLSMSIFTTKFTIGMWGAMMSEPNESIALQALELFCTIILGIFAGRGIGCLVRYRAVR